MAVNFQHFPVGMLKSVTLIVLSGFCQCFACSMLCSFWLCTDLVLEFEHLFAAKKLSVLSCVKAWCAHIFNHLHVLTHAELPLPHDDFTHLFKMSIMSHARISSTQQLKTRNFFRVAARNCVCGIMTQVC